MGCKWISRGYKSSNWDYRYCVDCRASGISYPPSSCWWVDEEEELRAYSRLMEFNWREGGEGGGRQVTQVEDVHVLYWRISGKDINFNFENSEEQLRSVIITRSEEEVVESIIIMRGYCNINAMELLKYIYKNYWMPVHSRWMRVSNLI